MTSPRRAWLAAAVALIVLVAVSVALRWPGFTQGGFASHDVGGILYNAMLLDAGLLPYVDSVELKAPGTFYLAWLLGGPEARDIARLQIWANLWAIASLLGVAAIGGVLWGARAAVLAALVYGLGDAFLDSMDANYVTWAQLPQVLAVLAAALASRSREGRRRLGLWLVAGLFAGLATLCKRPAGAVLIVVAAWAAFADPKRRLDLRALAAIGLGFLGAHLPIAAHYLSHGQLGGLTGGYLFNTWGARYVGRRAASVGLVGGLREGSMALAYFLALPLFLALWTGLPRAERRRSSPLPWLWLWFAMTLVAASVGMRFYKGYFVAVGPALALLAAAPGGLLQPRPGQRVRWLRALALALVAGLALRSAWLGKAVRDDRGRVHDRGGRLLAEYIAKGTEPGDRIWVWGWHLWDVYAFTGHLSGSTIYKSLGLLTPPNDDTWRTPASKLVISEDMSYRTLLIDELSESMPRYIALGSTVPRGDFPELREFLRSSYVRDRGVRVGRVELWRRRDPPPKG